MIKSDLVKLFIVIGAISTASFLESGERALENVAESITVATSMEKVEPVIVEALEPLVDDDRQYWKYEISYYCSCYSCTQNTTDKGRTASGVYAKEGVTIATPNDIPFGSKVIIDDLGEFIVQDRGGYIDYSTDDLDNTIMRLDIYLDSHEECIVRGRHYGNGYIVLPEEG